VHARTRRALWSATELAAAIRTRKLGSEELLDHVLARVERLNPAINAVVTLDEAGARGEARRADALTARSSPADLPPLHGLPITIKDALATAGLRSTGGAEELLDFVPTVDAPAVAAVRRAGAVVFGKTNLPRWSGDFQSFNAMFGTTNNPWDVTRTPGGSSGGAAAAVACGLSSFELGTDIAGSIRMPAAFCGVFGHKPSYGIVPGQGYLDQVQGGLIEADVNVIGPLARSAADLQLLLGIIAGPTPDKAPAWRLELPPPRHANLGDYRVAAWLDDPALPIDPSQHESLERAAAALEAAGCPVDRRARPRLDAREAWLLGQGLIGAATIVSADDASFANLAKRADAADPNDADTLRVRILAGRHRDWLGHHRRRTELRQVWDDFFTDYDVLLCPVTLRSAFPHLHEGSLISRSMKVGGVDRPYLDMIAWTSLIGLAYLPVTVPPIGLDAEGLPVGIQVVAPYLHDRSALHVGSALAELLGGYQPPPMALSLPHP
jgi:amidase